MTLMLNENSIKGLSGLSVARRELVGLREAILGQQNDDVDLQPSPNCENCSHTENCWGIRDRLAKVGCFWISSRPILTC